MSFNQNRESVNGNTSIPSNDQAQTKAVEEQMQQQTKQEQPEPDPTQPQRRSFFSHFRSPLSKSSDKDIRRLIEFTKEIIDKGDERGQIRDRYKITPYSSQNTGTFGGFAISVKGSLGGKLAAPTYIFILEKSRAPIPPRQEQTPFGPVKIVVTTADAYTKEFVREVTSLVRRDWNSQALDVIPVSAQIIERELNIEAEEDFHPMVMDAVMAILSFFDWNNPKSQKFSLSEIVEDGNVQAYTHVYLNKELQRGNTLPIRSDIVSELSVKSLQRTSSGVPSEKDQTIARTSAYVDLIPTPPPQTYGQTTTPVQPWFVPRITITDLSTDLAESSLEFALMGIANTTILARNKSYGVVWKQHHADPAVASLRDFGALGLIVKGLAPEAGVLDVAGSDQELRRLMDTILNPHVVYSLEVADVSPTAWLTKIFADASIQGPAGAGARRAIMKAANTLTGNRFSTILSNMFGGNIPELWCTSGTNDRNYVGYYVLNGQRRDIREIDLLAFTNLVGRKDIDLVGKFISTLSTKSGEDMFMRLFRRLSILDTLVTEVVIKGYSTKINFNGVFISALVSAIEGTGLVVTNNAAGLRDNAPVSYTTQDWASAMTNPMLGGQMFGTNQQVYPGYPQQGFGQPQGYPQQQMYNNTYYNPYGG